MTQQPFSRPGAIDLSALRPAPRRRPCRPVAPAPSDGRSAYAVRSTSRASSRSLGVVDDRARRAACSTPHPGAREAASWADDLSVVAERARGPAAWPRWSTSTPSRDRPGHAGPSDACDGRPRRPTGQPPFQARSPLEELRRGPHPARSAAHHPGHHRAPPAPAGGAPAAEGEEEAVDPRYAPAQDALEADDIDGAVAEYQKLVDANPRTPRRPPGSRWPR